MIMKNGKIVDGDIMSMVERYKVLSSTEAWIICELGREIKRLREAHKTAETRILELFSVDGYVPGHILTTIAEAFHPSVDDTGENE